MDQHQLECARALVHAGYRARAEAVHPDHGGNHDDMVVLTDVYRAMLAALPTLGPLPAAPVTPQPPPARPPAPPSHRPPRPERGRPGSGEQRTPPPQNEPIVVTPGGRAFHRRSCPCLSNAKTVRPYERGMRLIACTVCWPADPFVDDDPGWAPWRTA